MTDLPNRLLPRPGAPAAGAASRSPAEIDVLSDVLRCIRLTASMLFLVEATSPWRTDAPAARSFAPFVLPAGQHLISYHIVTAGNCWAGIQGEPAQPMAAGDVLVVPHGDPYHLANPASAAAGANDAEAVEFFRRMVAGELPRVVTEGGNRWPREDGKAARHEGGAGPQRTRFICGFLGCEARPFNPILAALPAVLHLRRTMQDNRPMRHLIALAQAELEAGRPGSREVLLRLSELLFIAAIRCHAQQLAQQSPRPQLANQPAGLAPLHAECAPVPGEPAPCPPVHGEPAPLAAGWLAGLHDPLVGRVLALLHARPEQAWTLQALAAQAGASRSVLATRFAHVVGQPPMRYLAGWRMQLATRMLAEPAAKVRTVALAVGYESEAAFSRAFTRLVGSNPVAWRNPGFHGPRASRPIASRPIASRPVASH
jgi:AraC-like DNA-binding protein